MHLGLVSIAIGLAVIVFLLAVSVIEQRAALVDRNHEIEAHKKAAATYWDAYTNAVAEWKSEQAARMEAERKLRLAVERMEGTTGPHAR